MQLRRRCRCTPARGAHERELSYSAHYFNLHVTLAVDTHFTDPETHSKEFHEVWLVKDKQRVVEPKELFSWLGHFEFEAGTAVVSHTALASIKAFLHEEDITAAQAQRRGTSMGQGVPQPQA